MSFHAYHSTSISLPSVSRLLIHIKFGSFGVHSCTRILPSCCFPTFFARPFTFLLFPVSGKTRTNRVSPKLALPWRDASSMRAPFQQTGKFIPNSIVAACTKFPGYQVRTISKDIQTGKKIKQTNKTTKKHTKQQGKSRDAQDKRSRKEQQKDAWLKKKNK